MEEEHDGSINIPVGNQVFDLAFHPGEDIVYAGLLTGEVKAFKYHDDGSYEQAFSIRPTKRSCRGLATNADGSRLYGVTKDKTIEIIDTTTGKVLDSKLGAHDDPLNRVLPTLPHQLATGDDEGVVRLWDTRTLSSSATPTHTYDHHSDFISDFLWLEDKKHLVATSGDGTLSVMDVRSKKTVPFAQSEDQEDELLSVVAIKGGTKLAVGTQLGILSIFDRKKGYGDIVDRIPGHPTSIDALLSITDDVIATGSSDGLIRFVQLHPTKFLGVVADHGEFPVERLRMDRRGKWLGSASHDEVVKLTDVEGALEESDDEGEDKEDDSDDSDEGEGTEKEAEVEVEKEEEEEADGAEIDTDDSLDDAATPDSDEEMTDVPAPEPVAPVPNTGRALEVDSDEEEQPKKKKRKKKKKGGAGDQQQKQREAFFAGL
ncbi:WD40 repeat-like protein [Calocera viscosa TUFC12733]|uniref:WD repeat-containing protein JIP5 n=1 Tax=Calocera viscosa (strain TUFC12733) TaxID=1330018 RepID=A0A167KJI4_CALVF|nr:WD40 repeat-like protein [Calocera viscosa TUFC12733]